MKLDVLAIGAHPDDAELGVGGILAKLSARGYRTGILDLSRGESASRGDAATRAEEAQRAAERLGIAVRVNAGLPDTRLADAPDQRDVLVRHLRTLRPRMLLAPMAPDRHPDHEAAHRLARAAVFLAGVARYDTGHDPFRPETLYFYHAYYQPDFRPSMVIDVSPYFESKRKALREYRSQFHNPEHCDTETFVSSRAFWEDIETRARYWGARIGAEFGEPLHTEGPIGLDLPPGLGAPQGN